MMVANGTLISVEFGWAFFHGWAIFGRVLVSLIICRGCILKFHVHVSFYLIVNPNSMYMYMFMSIKSLKLNKIHWPSTFSSYILSRWLKHLLLYVPNVFRTGVPNIIDLYIPLLCEVFGNPHRRGDTVSPSS